MVARGMDAWTSSLRATHSHAQTTATPASERAMLALDTFGRQFVGLLQDGVLTSCSWRTWTDISVLEPGKSFGICKDLATQLRADALARRKSARLTKENDSSSWQSPDAQGFNSRKQVGQTDREPMLTGQALQWATANAKDSSQRMYQNANGDPTNPMPTLPGHARNWASPVSPSGGAISRSGNRQDELLLNGQAAQFAQENQDAQSQVNCKRNGSKSSTQNEPRTGNCENARSDGHWATPRSSPNENRNTKAAPSHGLTHGETASGQAVTFPYSLPVEPTTGDGLNSLLEVWTRPTCPRLSPAFQFWLMGWPHPQTFYGSAETASCHCAPPSHSCTCSRRLWSQWRRKNLSALCSLLLCEDK